MNTEKQIDEMARDLCNEIGIAVVIVRVRDDGTVCLTGSEKYLKNLIYKGYRKASEVAAEIFAEIDTLMEDYKHNYIQGIQFIAQLAELKKKYTGGEG